jgi:ribonuclease J
MDGSRDLAPIVLRDRQMLANAGFVSCTVVLGADGTLAATPEIVSRGVFHVDDNPDLIAGAAGDVEAALRALPPDAAEEERHEAVRLALRRFYRRELGRRPMILPVFVRID